MLFRSAKGTPELKPINDVTKEKVRGMILNKIIPAIVEKFPRNYPASGRPTICYIQNDNTGPPINKNDKEFMEVVKGIQDIEIRIDPQPAMSPDLNVLDLSFFNSLQSLHYKKLCHMYEDLCMNVENAFKEYQHENLSNIWLTLQSIYNEVIKSKGGNNYKLPHTNKKKLLKAGRLPSNLSIETEALEILMEHCSYLKKKAFEETEAEKEKAMLEAIKDKAAV